MSKKIKAAPEVTRVERTVRLIDVTVAKTEQDPERRLYFTTHDTPVTVDGHQYIPLSIFDQAKWLAPKVPESIHAEFLKEDISKWTKACAVAGITDDTP